MCVPGFGYNHIMAYGNCRSTDCHICKRTYYLSFDLTGTNSVVPVTCRIRVHTNSGSKPRFNDSVYTCK